jgi:hypothetical protein
VPLAVDDTSVELFGPSAWGAYTWGGASSVWDGAGVRWSGEEWNAVDCQVTQAAMTWGGDDTAGVIVQSAAGQLIATTYDPDGLLDPANSSSPYRPMLAPGTPFRISYAGSPLRTGRLAEATYDRGDGTGRLEGRDAIAELAAAQTAPTFRASSNALRAFAVEVIAAASLTIPVEGVPGSGDSVIAWRERTGGQNVWGLIRDAAFDALHLAYVDSTGLLRFAPYGAPVDRGTVIGDGGICLEELETATGDQGTYTDIADGAGVLVASGLAQPRMLSVDRREPAGSSWAAAIAADRATGAIQYRPSMIRPDSTAELDRLAGMRGVDLVRLKLDTPPAIDVYGRVLGGALRAPAGGYWSATVNLYVPPSSWAYVPPTPAAVTGTPIAASVIADADTDAGLYWNSNLPTPKAMGTGAGRQSQFTVQGGAPAAGASAQAKSRGLIRFDLTADGLFDGFRIYRSAKLRIYAAGVSPGTGAVIVRRSLEPWAEGYGNAPFDFNNSGAIWPGPILTSSGEVTLAAPTAAGWWEADITAIARTWLPRSLGGDALPNLGLCVLLADEVTNLGITFRSRETTLGTPPTLVINGEG